VLLSVVVRNNSRQDGIYNVSQVCMDLYVRHHIRPTGAVSQPQKPYLHVEEVILKWQIQQI
jgi:hypothetical protein